MCIDRDCRPNAHCNTHGGSHSHTGHRAIHYTHSHPNRNRCTHVDPIANVDAGANVDADSHRHSNCHSSCGILSNTAAYANGASDMDPCPDAFSNANGNAHRTSGHSCPLPASNSGGATADTRQHYPASDFPSEGGNGARRQDAVHHP